MKYIVDGSPCDTYVYIDRPETGNVFLLSAQKAHPTVTVACLYAARKLHPVHVDENTKVECHIIGKSKNVTVDCATDVHGCVQIPLPEDMCAIGEYLDCEIGIRRNENSAKPYICRTFNFGIAIIS